MLKIKNKGIIMAWESFKLGLSNFFSTSGVLLLHGIILFTIGYIIIKVILKITMRILAKGRIEKSARKFLYNVVKYVLYLLLIMIIANALGVSITGFVALLSAAGLAVSLALQGSLSNLANGIIIIITKPFKQGDFVRISDFEGTISEIKMTHTILISNDNKEISVPNKLVVENTLLNSSVLENKKVVYSFLVSYKSDVDKVKNIILKAFNGTNLVLKTPKPFVALQSLEANGIRFTASCFCESKHYLDVYHSVLEEIFNSFKKENIVLPYAQLEVNLKEEKENLPYYKESKLIQKQDKPETKVAKEDVFNKEIKEETKQSEVEEEGLKEYLNYVNEVDIIEEIEIDEVHEEDEIMDNEEHNSQDKNSYNKFNNLFNKMKPKHKEKKPRIIIKKK